MASEQKRAELCCSRPRYPTSPFQPSACFHQSSVRLSTPYTLFGGAALVERTTRRKIVSHVETCFCWPFIISVSARQSVSACQSELSQCSFLHVVQFYFDEHFATGVHTSRPENRNERGIRRDCVWKRRRIGQVLDEPNSAIPI